MSRIRSKDTTPEKKARKILTQLGWRYRLHVSQLPGKPDIVIKKAKTAIFINGCFWHQHKGCKRKTMPKDNEEYWKPKLEKNVARQKKDISKLKKDGWKVKIIWECETKDETKLIKKVEEIL